MDGWLCLDKPKGMSSNSAMVKVRKHFGENTGYVGTLDPFATGVLPIGVGRARKFIQFVEEVTKKYEFTVVFGASTNTYDETGEIIGRTNVIPNANEIQKVLPDFLGEIVQIPPKFSAIKLNGRRSCDLARKNIAVEIPSRIVQIKSLELISAHDDVAKFSVVCGKGTYVRSLAVDIAAKLGSLCYVRDLRRLMSGFFSIEKSISLENLLKISDTTELVEFLIPIESPLDDIPALVLDEDTVTRLKHGLTARTSESSRLQGKVRIFDSHHKFYGICNLEESGQLSVIKMYIDE